MRGLAVITVRAAGDPEESAQVVVGKGQRERASRLTHRRLRYARRVAIIDGEDEQVKVSVGVEGHSDVSVLLPVLVASRRTCITVCAK